MPLPAARYRGFTDCTTRVCDGISVSAVRIAIINDSGNNTALANRAGIKGTAACRQSGNETADQVVQISGPPWGNSTHPGIMASPGNSSSAFQNSAEGKWTGAGLGSSMDPSAGIHSVANGQPGGAPTAVGSGSPVISSGLGSNQDFPSGTDIGADPAAITSRPGTGIAGPAGTDGPSTLVTVTTPNRPGQDGQPGAIDGDTATGTGVNGGGPAGPGTAGTGPVATATGTDFSSPLSGPGANLNVPSQTGAPDYTVDGQVIPGGGNMESGGLQTGTALAAAQVTGDNGDKSSVNGGDSVLTGGANPAQPGPASTCLCK